MCPRVKNATSKAGKKEWLGTLSQLRCHTTVSRLWPSFPAAQLGKYLLHLPEDVAKTRRLLHPHPVRTKTEAKPPGAVEGVLLLPSEPIVAEPIFFVIVIIVVVVVMSHGIEEGVPVAEEHCCHFSIYMDCYLLSLSASQSSLKGQGSYVYKRQSTQSC